MDEDTAEGVNNDINGDGVKGNDAANGYTASKSRHHAVKCHVEVHGIDVMVPMIFHRQITQRQQRQANFLNSYLYTQNLQPVDPHEPCGMENTRICA